MGYNVFSLFSWRKKITESQLDIIELAVLAPVTIACILIVVLMPMGLAVVIAFGIGIGCVLGLAETVTMHITGKEAHWFE
jgi:hypothetical protein